MGTLAEAVSKNQIQVTFNEFTEKETTENIQNYTVETDHKGGAGNRRQIRRYDRRNAGSIWNLSVNHVKDLVTEMTEENVLKVVFGYLGEYKFEEEEGNTAQNSKDVKEQYRLQRTGTRPLSMDGVTSYLDLGNMKGNVGITAG